MTKKIQLFFLLTIILNIIGVSEALSQSGLNKRLYPGMNRRIINSRQPLSRQVIYKWTYVGGAGVATYFGDLCENINCYNKTNYQFNLGLKRRFNTRFSGGVNLRTFKISGSDAANGSIENGRRQRNLSFASNCYSLDAQVVFDFLPIYNKYSGTAMTQHARRRTFMPFAFAGLGLMYFNPYAYTKADKKVFLHDLKTEENKKYSRLTPVVSYGLGVRFKVSDYLDLTGEVAYNITFSDYLDDVGGKYPANNLDPAFASTLDGQMADRGPELNSSIGRRNPVVSATSANPPRGGKGNDGYYFFNVKAEYTVANLGSFKNQKVRRTRR